MARKERVGVQVQQSVAEPPGVPDESVLIEGPDVRTHHVGAEMSDQGIGENQGQNGVEGDDEELCNSAIAE